MNDMAQSKSEKSNMFIRVGNRLLNSQYIVEIRPRSHAHGEDNATIILHDGTTHTGFMPESAINALAEQIIPALPGYEAYVQYNFDFDYDVDDENSTAARMETRCCISFTNRSAACSFPLLSTTVA
jgi:hypothetical protein